MKKHLPIFFHVLALLTTLGLWQMLAAKNGPLAVALAVALVVAVLVWRGASWTWRTLGLGGAFRSGWVRLATLAWLPWAWFAFVYVDEEVWDGYNRGETWATLGAMLFLAPPAVFFAIAWVWRGFRPAEPPRQRPPPLPPRD